MSHRSCTIVGDEVIKTITDAITIDYYPISLKHSDKVHSLDELFGSHLKTTQEGFESVIEEMVDFGDISEGEAHLLKVLWNVRSELLNGLERDMP